MLPADFNSIKVRLEQATLKDNKMNYPFQFHKGTIRTRVLCRQFNQFVVFQFHKGTIRTDLSHNDVFSCAPFQFHKGTIRTKEEAADTER